MTVYANYGPYAYDGGSNEDEEKVKDTTPVDNNLYDYSQAQAQASDSPWADNTPDDSAITDTAQQPTTPEVTPVAQDETARTAAAAEANANVHEAANASSGMRDVTPEEMNGIYQKTGVTPEEWQRITTTVDVNALLADTSKEGQKYRDAINMYMGLAQQPQTTAQQAPTENQILPSAGGSKYQADSIYDPTKTYGRQPDGSYVFSNSAAQLQRDLNKAIDAGLVVDGYFGEKTQQALNDYLAQYGTPTSTKPSAAEANADTPMSQAGSMSEAQQKATNTNTKQATAQTTGGNTNPSDTFYDQIKRGWDKLWHGDNGTQSSEPASNTTAASQPQADYEPYSFNWFVDEYKSENPNASEQEAREWAGQQIIGIQNGEIERPQGQVYGSPRYGGVGEKPWNLTVDSLKADLDRMKEEGNSGVQEGQFAKNDQQYALWHFLHPSGTLDEYYRIYPNRAPTETVTEETAPSGGTASAPVYGTPRSESPTNGTAKAAFTYNTEAPPQWIPKNNPDEGLADLLPKLDLIPEASADEMRQITMESSPLLQSRSMGGRPAGIESQTPSIDDIAMQQQLAELMNEWNANNPGQPVYGESRYGGIPERYTAPSEDISSDDIQSSGTGHTPLTAEERFARIPETETGYNTPYTTPNYFAEEQDSEAAKQAMESNYGERVPTNNETMYLFQYISDMDNLKKQFPGYSDSALMDMVLFNEEMRNGQSSYYKWLAKQL